MAVKNALIKGETATLAMRMPSEVVSPPSWTLYDRNAVEVLTGFADQQTNNMWSATITVPPTAVLVGGEETWELEFSSMPGLGRSITKSLFVTVTDAFDQWQSHGLLYKAGAASIKHTLFYDSLPSSIVLALNEGYDTEDATPLFEQTLTDPTAASVTSRGYAFSVSLPVTGISKNSGAGRYPYQLSVTATFADLPNDEAVIPVYVMTPQIARYVNDLTRYLDKARLVEVDANLQWATDELVHYVLNGVEYINGVKEPSFWSVHDIPIQLQGYVSMAAAWVALNARFLAEGMTNFEFQGSNTQLNFNRRDAVQTKMDELRSVLEGALPQAKTATIRTYGAGVPPSGLPGVGKRSSPGRLGVGYGPMINRSNWPTLGVGSGSNGRWRLF